MKKKCPYETIKFGVEGYLYYSNRTNAREGTKKWNQLGFVTQFIFRSSCNGESHGLYTNSICDIKKPVTLKLEVFDSGNDKADETYFFNYVTDIDIASHQCGHLGFKFNFKKYKLWIPK